jgi:hypothetical protein
MIFYVKATPCVCIPSLIDSNDILFKVVVDKYLDIPAGIAVAPSDE